MTVSSSSWNFSGAIVATPYDSADPGNYAGHFDSVYIHTADWSVYLGLASNSDLFSGTPATLPELSLAQFDNLHFLYMQDFSGYPYAAGNLSALDAGISAVPIPPTALLMGTGILGLVGLGWRRKGKATA